MLHYSHYFAKDGNYGDSFGLVVVDTSDWTEEHWVLIDEAMDDERPEIAERINAELSNANN